MANVEKSIRLAFDLARKVAESPDRYPDEFIAIPLDPKTLSWLLSEERVRLLRTVRDDGPFASVSRLAAAVHRDQGRVSRDLIALSEAGLVVLERQGKSKIVRAPSKPIVLA